MDELHDFKFYVVELYFRDQFNNEMYVILKSIV